MSSPSPIPPPNDRRNSRASSNADPPDTTSSNSTAAPSGFVVGGPPGSPSPLALRASHSRSSMRRKSRIARIPPDIHLLDYVSPPDNNLVCLICHSAFDRPVRLACEHYFCHVCLNHAWDAQPEGHKTCPTCRNSVDPAMPPLPVPKILETMLDELVVKCSNTKSGCSWVGQRANMHDHVMLYCEYSLVECASFDCRLPVSQKDYHKGCLHYTVSCEHCHVSLLKRDLEEHQRTICQNRMTTCPSCSTELLRLDLQAHIKDVCIKVVVQCQGTAVGCTQTAERAEITEHEKGCPMASMAPYFREMHARTERSEARFEILARKVGILEDGLTNITDMLYPANANDSSFPINNPLDPNNPDSFPPAALIPTPDFRLPPASFPPVPPSNDQSQTPSNNPAQPPFDSQIHHLLTLHESLRDEVSRISNALLELEGRTNMMIVNENQRVKEDMLHINAAMNSIRMQLHWMMSARLQQRGGTSSSTSAGSSSGRAGGSTSASGNTNGGGAAAQGAGSSRLGVRSVATATLHTPRRRLSDSTRQDTKL